ncbi:MAG: hypothetical protein HKN29_15340, partial [Rhodothermales bacterium]|nr:hypothetical protein [Rhodothermales bacterium]
MLKNYGMLVAVLATAAITIAPVSAQTTRYVDTGGSDAANDCSASGTPCLTIDHALDEADAGDTIEVGAGTFTESVSFDKGVTLECAQADVNPSGRTAGGAAETVINPTGVYVFEIRTSNVTINGCDIDGADTASTWAGVRIWNSGSASNPDDISSITIENNFIRDVIDPNPAGVFNYAHGIWAIGGGSDGTRGSISGLTIDSNSIYGIGDGNDIGVAPSGTAGAGMYLKSIFGATAGAGAT